MLARFLLLTRPNVPPEVTMIGLISAPDRAFLIIQLSLDGPAALDADVS